MTNTNTDFAIKAATHTVLMTITPEVAEALLQGNVNNRPVQNATVKKYADEMAAGKWQVTHQGIAITSDGKLLDGQHRLLAVLKSGVTLTALCTLNADPSTFSVLDAPKVRRVSDSLAVAGETDTSKMAAVARMALRGLYGKHLSQLEIHEFAIANRDVIKTYTPLCPPYTALIAGVFTRAHLAGLHGVEAAAERMLKMEFTGPNDPMCHLAKRLRDVKTDGWKGSSAKYRAAVAALRAVDSGKPMLVLRETKFDIELAPQS